MVPEFSFLLGNSAVVWNRVVLPGGALGNAKSITLTHMRAQLEDGQTYNCYSESGRANAITQSTNLKSSQGKMETLAYGPGRMEPDTG